MNRRVVAARVGFDDQSLGIPEARWMRAMTFEALVHADRFVSELVTKAVGQLGLPRPKAIRRRSGEVSTEETAIALVKAHDEAVAAETATMLTSLAIPFMQLEDSTSATPVKPDFAVVCPRSVDGDVVGSWLIMGDAKDYERIRSRIDDARLLKGFLQVALGAESAEVWSKLPPGMAVHRYGALAVPRNAFLQPEASVELLDDHRREVRARAEERLATAATGTATLPESESELAAYLTHIDAEFDPATCTTCNLFSFCRHQLRNSAAPESLLIEVGVERPLRPAVVGLVDGSGNLGTAPSDVVANVRATVTGLPQWKRRRRTDPAGLPGTINLVLAKSDAAALGVHGIALQRIGAPGPGQWVTRCYAEPQAPQTRRSIMSLIGESIRQIHQAGEGPVHLVVPDKPTADLLVSMADSLAGVELSRLRWQRDVEMGRTPLTFDGEPATIPEALAEDERLGVSFLLEEDRARAMSLRSPIVDLRQVLGEHLVAGGPSSDSGRLDYVVRWAEATEPLDHRQVSDQIAAAPHTPGARLANTESDEIHRAHRSRASDPVAYQGLVRQALDYKVEILQRALNVLAALPPSRLRDVHRSLEASAQEVWGRRLALKASDLVRFSRTYRTWRNAHVDMLDADATCFSQLSTLADVDFALDRALDAGVRELAVAHVLQVHPLRLDVSSRRLTAGSSVVALHINADAVVELGTTTLTVQKGSFKFGQVPVGPFASDGGEGLAWYPTVVPVLAVGDRLVLADAGWFTTFQSGHEIAIKRPGVDDRAAPKATCTSSSYEQAPADHYWCCRPHEAAEAEWADTLAARRAKGELNPETWPPLVDEDRFDVSGTGEDDESPAESGAVPANLTLDDIE